MLPLILSEACTGFNLSGEEIFVLLYIFFLFLLKGTSIKHKVILITSVINVKKTRTKTSFRYTKENDREKRERRRERERKVEGEI